MNIKEEIKKADLEDHAMVHLTGCFGFCAMGPIVKVYPDNVFYVHVKPDDAEEIVNSHIARNEVVERLLFEEPALDYKKVQKHEDMQFYKKQLRVALRNCGHINPENININNTITCFAVIRASIIYFSSIVIYNI